MSKYRKQTCDVSFSSVEELEVQIHRAAQQISISNGDWKMKWTQGFYRGL